MEISNIQLGNEVRVDPSSSVNNVTIGNHVKISKYCSIFGSKINPLIIGDNTTIGMQSILNGFACQLIIGNYVSIAQKVNIMTDSGPNASEEMQKYFPLIKGNVIIGDHSWIGANAVILPGVTLGEFCVVGANSLVSSSFPAYSVIGGSPASLIRVLKRI